MKKRRKSRTKAILLTVAAFFFVVFFLLPMVFSLFDGDKFGNVALIPLEGIITTNGAGGLGQSTISSTEIIGFIEQAEENGQVKVIALEINSPGGSAVASDEIANALKKSTKPVVSVIREVGASGGYWIASATDHIVANRMSITGSIGVISSYLEFSGLMQDYGIGYEQLTSGKYKDVGTPFRKLQNDEKQLLQKKLDRIHDYFIQEVAENRDMTEEQVKKIATGEFFIGIEAFDLGLVDELGDKETLKKYIEKTYDLDVDFIIYKRQAGFFDLFSGVFEDFSFNMGQGMGFAFKQNNLQSSVPII